MLYTPVKVDVPSRYHEKIKKAVVKGEAKSSVSIKINLSNTDGNDTLLLTKGQIAKIERARLIGKKNMTVRLSRKQVAVNVKHEGGFLGMLIAALSAAIPSIVSAATAAAPAVIASAATGAISGAISKAVSGNGLYLQKNGQAVKLRPVKGGGLYLTPHPMIDDGNGLFLKNGSEMYRDIDKSSPIKTQCPILELLV